MNMPGFTGERSLYETRGHYWHRASSVGVTIAQVNLAIPIGPLCPPFFGPCVKNKTSAGCSQVTRSVGTKCQLVTAPCACPPPIQCGPCRNNLKQTCTDSRTGRSFEQQCEFCTIDRTGGGCIKKCCSWGGNDLILCGIDHC